MLRCGIHIKSQFFTIKIAFSNLFYRVNETSVRFTREGGNSYRLELDSGVTYHLSRRTENPGLWSLDDDQIIRREFETKVRKLADDLLK